MFNWHPWWFWYKPKGSGGRGGQPVWPLSLWWELSFRETTVCGDSWLEPRSLDSLAVGLSLPGRVWQIFSTAMGLTALQSILTRRPFLGDSEYLISEHSSGFCFSILLPKPIIGKWTEREEAGGFIYSELRKLGGTLFKNASHGGLRSGSWAQRWETPQLRALFPQSFQPLLELVQDLFLPWLEQQNKTQRENPTPNCLSLTGGKVTVRHF